MVELHLIDRSPCKLLRFREETHLARRVHPQRGGLSIWDTQRGRAARLFARPW